MHIQTRKSFCPNAIVLTKSVVMKWQATEGITAAAVHVHLGLLEMTRIPQLTVRSDCQADWLHRHDVGCNIVQGR